MFDRTENYPLIIQKKNGRDFKRYMSFKPFNFETSYVSSYFYDIIGSSSFNKKRSVSICTQEVLLSTFVHIFVINSLRVAQDNEKLH